MMHTTYGSTPTTGPIVTSSTQAQPSTPAAGMPVTGGDVIGGALLGAAALIGGIPFVRATRRRRTR